MEKLPLYSNLVLVPFNPSMFQDIMASPLIDEKSGEKAEHAFKCLICDFTSNWENQLQIHMTRKPNTIEQIDGNSTFDSEEIDNDKKYNHRELSQPQESCCP